MVRSQKVAYYHCRNISDMKLNAWLPSLAIAALLLSSPALAQNQQELNQKADQAYKRADAELNRLWKKLQPSLSAGAKDKLITSQEQWIKFRDAEAEAKAAIFEGGSMAPMIYSNSLRATTEQRIRELRAWIEATSN